MGLSKFQTCMVILQFVAKNEAPLEQISSEMWVSSGRVEECLELLLKNGLIQKRINLQNKVKYNSTSKGERILAYFRSNVTNPFYTIT